MIPLKGSEIFGNWGTVLLALNLDDSIDFGRLENEIDILIESKVNGIYSNGTAGEFYNQSESEFDKIQQILSEKCHASGTLFQIGCSHSSPLNSLKRVQRAKDLKPGAIQIILPDWHPVNNMEMLSYLQKIAEVADPIGLIIYNPPHAKKVLTAEDYHLISQTIPNVVGCKVSGGDKSWYNKMLNMAAGLSVFVAGHRLASGFSMGAKGSYSNMACLNPVAAQKWYDLMLIDLNAALEIESRIGLFFTEFIIPYITEKNYSSQAVDKLLAAIGGWADAGTRLRWPYQGIDVTEVERLRVKCKDYLPEFFR